MSLLFATDIMKLFADSRVTYLFVFKKKKTIRTWQRRGFATQFANLTVLTVQYLQSSVTRLLS
jgi:hypothetical protein